MEKIDLVYILGQGSHWHNNEIRYSLRSVEKYFKYRKIFVIGEKPEWLTGVTHIPETDTNDNKLMNARAKYLIAANDSRISKDFILMNDDFFFLKEIKTIPYYSRGTIDEMIKRHPTKRGYYYSSLVDTKNKLSAMGIEKVKDYEVHCPIILNKEKLITAASMAGNTKPYLLRTIYGNLNNEKAKKVMDFKASNLAEFAHQTIKERELLSINDALVAAEEFRVWLYRKFINKSSFELDDGNGSKILPGRCMASLKHYAIKPFDYGKKYYNPGDIIQKKEMDEIKNIPKLKEMWRLK